MQIFPQETFMKTLALGMLCFFLFTSTAFGDSADQRELLVESVQVLEEVQRSPDKQIPASLIRRAKAIIVFPTMLKGGFIVAARYGSGVAAVRNGKTGKWGPPAFLKTYGASFGFQIGAEAVDLVLLVMTQRGIKGLLKSKFTLGADIAVTAGPVGRHAEAGTDVTFKGEIYSYSRSKGAFAGVSVKGAVISADDDANWGYYNRPLSPKDILIDHRVKKYSESTRRFIKSLGRITSRK
jgi:lipid-binding SYLF domain-containing protein